MVKVFSFCIYGDNKKYLDGLLENIKIIIEKFSDYHIWIYAGNVPEEYEQRYKGYKQVKYIYTDISDACLMCYRLFPIDSSEVEVCFVRDSDSRIGSRDIWCINQFLESDFMSHTIRDHPYHKAKIMCGLFGIKSGALNYSIESVYNNWIHTSDHKGKYNVDVMLMDKLYSTLYPKMLIHTNCVAFKDETTHRINVPMEDNFCGNVVNEQGRYDFSYYTYPVDEHIGWLSNEKQFDVVCSYMSEVYKNVPWYDRSIVYMRWFKCALATMDIAKCQEALSSFEYAIIDENVIQESNLLFNIYRHKGYRVIGTTDPSRQPKDKEIVVCYGNQCHNIDCLPSTNHVFRHAVYYNDIVHDSFESSSAWDSIGIIYILNLVERYDRYMDILVELCSLHAPLPRIYHYKATKQVVTGDNTLDGYLGASKNHLDVVKHFVTTKHKYCMILEDDVCFNENKVQLLENLEEFFKRDYKFDVCLMNYSKYHEVKPYDSILNLCYQHCTTSSAYILTKDTIDRILQVFEEGYSKMLETKDVDKYIIDRYWSKLQCDNRFFVFKNKFGYQRCNYSQLRNQVNCYYD